MNERYELLDVIAIQWNPQLAEQFPDADHFNCRQQMQPVNDRWVPFTPAKCVGYHCHLCGSPCNVMGHHNCERKETNP